MNYRAFKCPCGHRACTSWGVDPVSPYQGAHFTERQARATARLLNAMDQQPDAPTITVAVADLPPDTD
jgi:hypothetical protein